MTGHGRLAGPVQGTNVQYPAQVRTVSRARRFYKALHVTQHRPNFLVIGAQRGGSTWLWQALRSHPEFFLSSQKEMEFFSYRRNLNKKGWSEYLRHFEPGSDYRWRGECSPSYLISVDRSSPWFWAKRGFNPRIPEAVREYLGESVRLVVSLRDPVERAVSALFHHAAHGRIRRFSGLLKSGRERHIVDAGFYARHLRRWYEVFPAEQIHVCDFAQIVAQPQRVLDQLAGFFSVAQWPREAVSAPPANTGQKTIRLAGLEWPLQSPLTGPFVTDWARRELAEIYAEDRQALVGLIGRDPFALGDQNE